MRLAWFATGLLLCVALGSFAWFQFGLGQSAPQAAQTVVDATRIRVGISDDAMTSLEYPTAQISATGPFTLTDAASGQVLKSAEAGEIITATVNTEGFSLSSNRQKDSMRSPVAGPMKIQVLNESHRLKIVNITRRGVNPQFRGSFEIARGTSDPNRLTVINEVALEDYLKAVVPNELPMHYGVEAVKAQSVAARNYALRPREKPWQNFDICDSQYCQVYLGSQTETPGSNQTIATTAGLLALYQGEPVLALFSSSHGGYAENYANAFSDPVTGQFPAPVLPYLVGGADVPLRLKNPKLTTEAGAREFWGKSQPSYDVESPLYRWKRQWSRSQLETAINQGLLEVSREPLTKDFVRPLFKAGDSIGTLKKLQVMQRGTSGKIMVLRIEGSKGKWIVQKEFLVRKVLTHSGKMLPSANVVFTHQSGKQGELVGVLAQGGGFGHGVGMSQLGASWMSKHGKPFADIIRHYYKGASLGSIPIAVGKGGADGPIRTRFISHQTRGTLRLETGDGWLTPSAETVRIQLNGKDLEYRIQENRGDYSVELVPHQMNTVILYPDPRTPTRPIKAWVELYPARKS